MAADRAGGHDRSPQRHRGTRRREPAADTRAGDTRCPCCVPSATWSRTSSCASAPRSRGTDTPAASSGAAAGERRTSPPWPPPGGCATRFVGRVGDDEAGERARRVCSPRQGSTSGVSAVGRSGTVVVLVEPAGSGRWSPTGAATELGAVDPAWIVGVTWLHVPGYSLSPSRSARRRSVRRAAVRAGGRVSVDVSSVGGRRGVRATAVRRPAAVLGSRRRVRQRRRGRARSGAAPGCSSSRTAPRPVDLRHADGARDGCRSRRRRRRRHAGAGDTFAGGFLGAMSTVPTPSTRPRRRGAGRRRGRRRRPRRRAGMTGAPAGSTGHGARRRPRVRRHPAPGGAHLAEARRPPAAVEHRLPPSATTASIRISVTDGRAKTANLRRDRGRRCTSRGTTSTPTW